MRRITYKQLLLSATYYRGWFAAALAGLLVWFLLTGTHKGTEVLIANRDLTPGTILSSADFSRGWIEGSSAELFAKQILEDSKNVSFISAGSPLLLSNLGTGLDTERIVVNLPLEVGDNTAYPAGAAAHVWGFSEGLLNLISAEAIVLGTADSRMGAARIALSLPKSVESLAMKAQAVRVVLIGSFG